jgi:hypothetical protein
MSKLSYYIEDGLPTWPKAIGEVMDWTVGFTQWLDGQTIATAAVTCADPALTITGAQSIAGATAIKATIGGGVIGTTYLVHYSATVSATLVRIVTIRIKVVADRA